MSKCGINIFAGKICEKFAVLKKNENTASSCKSGYEKATIFAKIV
jgi:hypothetical protein